MSQPLEEAPRPEPISPVPARPRRGPRALGVLAALLLLLVAGALQWASRHLRGSLPQLDGELSVAGLSAAVRIDRDALGVPTIHAENRVDAARALGLLHGQERFFQMDLMRRHAAGELSELLGSVTVSVDKQARVHRFRNRAGRVLERTSERERELLLAYVAGVNTGLEALAAPPFEYALLRAEPAAWTPEDSVLVVYAMYFQLNDERGERESTRGLLHDLLGKEMFEFLAPWGTEWDAPIVGEALATPPIPGPEALDLRRLERVASRRPPPGGTEGGGEMALGSNNWAVAGTHTADGRALLANDMHLGLAVPTIWYRASLVYPAEAAAVEAERVTGVTLPGVPVVVSGSNGRVAWGFTNTYGDWDDLVVLEPVAGDPESYRAPDGPRKFEVHRETIRVKGAAEQRVEVRETIWGPVIDEDHRGRRRALSWVAHHPEGVSFALLEVEAARTLEELLLAASRVGAPPQNFVAVADDGRIGWTVMGAIPRRFGHDGRLPSSWADGDRGWGGWLEPAEYPRLVAPESGRIWTANARASSGEDLARIGHGGYPLGARAGQIRDRLLALDQATAEDLLAIQLDDRALFLARWRELLLELLDDEAVAADPRRAELRRLAENWGGRAAIDSAGYRLVRAFRLTVAERVFEPITAPCAEADDRFDYSLVNQTEGPLWRLVEERPLHLLDPRFATWDEALLAAVDATLDYFSEIGDVLAERTWGERNMLQIRHPLSRSIPAVWRFLDMPSEPLPGDSFMPRVQHPAEGASERLIVSPGREEEGYFHMPGGQSGHPMSQFYRAGHAAWARGEPRPFLPGPVEHTLVLRPGV